MRKFIYSILLFSICNLAFCQNKAYVININGTELMKEPTFNSDTLSILKAGTGLTFDSPTDITSNKNYERNLEIDGTWILVTSDNLEGFIISSDISKIKPALRNIQHHENCSLNTISLLGEKQSQTVELRKKSFGEITIEYEEEITIYENGVNNSYVIDGCYYDNYSFTKLSFSEVFHQLRSTVLSYGFGMEGCIIEYPVFKNYNNNKWVFYDIGLTDQIEIIKENSILRIESSGCN